MPNRILKESICVSETIDKLTPLQEVFFYRLIVNCDDFGRMDARPAVIRSKLFPLKTRYSIKDVECALEALADAGCVKLYESDGKPYLYLPTWEVHQTIRAQKSKYPEPNKHSESICKQLHANEINCKQMKSIASKCSRNPIQSESKFVFDNPSYIPPTGGFSPRGESENEQTVEKPVENSVEKCRRFIPPTVEEVNAYCLERKNGINAQSFCDFYESKGWLIGKSPMRDWKAAVRTWERDRRNVESEHKGSFDTDEFFKLALKRSYKD